MIPSTIVKNHIVWHPEDARIVVSIFPGAKIAPSGGNLLAAVPWTLEACRLLRNLGVEAPSPIRSCYDWPIRAGRTPGWWQIDTAEFLTMNPRAFVHSSMRTRKTLSTLWAVDFLQKMGVVKKCLVVAPLSTLERAWGDELFFNMPRKSFAVLHGSAEKRRKLLEQEHHIYIINHDGIETVHKELMARKDINLIVIDEVAVFRNSQTKRWKLMKALITPERMAWGLTGTPTPNEPTDAYGQCKLLVPENYPRHFTSFKNETMMQFGQFKWVPRKGSEEIVKRVLSPSIRFERSVVTDMEPTIIERHAELSPQQRHHYEELMRQAVTDVGGSIVTAVNAGVLVQKAAQCCCGVLYDGAGNFLRIDFGPRLKVLEELIEENEEKVLVFVPFTGALEAVAAELKKRWTVAVVDGSVPASRRAQIFSDFQQKKDPHVIVAHPQTMAHGLELTAASLIIWYAPCNKNEIYQQASARIDGGGQKVKIDVAHISSTALERRVYASLREKGRLQDVVLDLIVRRK